MKRIFFFVHLTRLIGQQIISKRWSYFFIFLKCLLGSDMTVIPFERLLFVSKLFLNWVMRDLTNYKAEKVNYKDQA